MKITNFLRCPDNYVLLMNFNYYYFQAAQQRNLSSCSRQLHQWSLAAFKPSRWPQTSVWGSVGIPLAIKMSLKITSLSMMVVTRLQDFLNVQESKLLQVNKLKKTLLLVCSILSHRFRHFFNHSLWSLKLNVMNSDGSRVLEISWKMVF